MQGVAEVCDGGLVFFFQAEDGIRDSPVTGVQTCALPICGRSDDPATREKFEERDNRELGVGIGESIAIADETISNSDITLDELTELAYKVIEKWTDT